MPRKQFIADVQVAADKSLLGITNVARGDDDGEVVASFVPPSGAPIEISLMAQPDVGSYPSESMFMVFTQADLPPAATAALEDVASFSAGMRLPELITILSQKLHSAFATGSRDAPYSIDDDSDTAMGGVNGDGGSQEGTDSDEPYLSDSGTEYGLGAPEGGGRASSATYRLSSETASKLNRRIRHDLRAAKMAGFTVGVLTGMKAESVSSLVSISIRVAQLGLSEEAIQAWDLEPQQYIVLLIRYSSGYKTFEAVITEPAKSHDIAFRVGVSNRYKPTATAALAAFTDVTKNMGNDDGEEKKDVNDQAGFSNLFISSSLNDFISQQFISLLKIRNSRALNWDGAKRYFNDKQGRFDETADLPLADYDEPSQKDGTLPDSISADHLTDHQVKEISFPLIAAQFAMRYLVRCTDFCLVCHDKIEEDFEALKPYVCSKPLCLYQYMSLGFGPSVEHEILTQPYVVDMLVSFCYSSAYNRRLREYPTGMSLSVPPVATSVTTAFVPHSYAPPHVNPAAANTEPVGIDAHLDISRRELIFEKAKTSPVQIGNWIVVSAVGLPPEHYRVEDVSLFPTIKLSDLPVTRVGMPPSLGSSTANMSTVPATPATTPPPTPIIAVKLAIYNQNFDDLDDIGKAESIVMLLETLPPVKEMRAYLLQQGRSSEPSLKNWKDRISPAALGMLRWIIASNRSCLVQVDKCPGQDETELAMSKIRLDQRVSNVADNWVQFRFAQGSPDKEQRFLDALRAQQANFDARYPTIFAFHGSPLPNWHSIIRSGLDFKEVSHGRAYGNGVYHAQDQNTSVGYAMPNQCTWPGSSLKISTAMSLNEIVNCPSQFTSSNPYLVVQHIDWIQCRYLFVQVAATDGYSGNPATVSHTPDASVEVEQDPKHTATSTLRKAIGVPVCAVKVSRNFRSTKGEAQSNKRRKNGFSASKSPMVEMGVASEGETLSDIEFLFSEDEAPTANDENKSKGKAIAINATPKANPKLTDFVPGSLDQSSLPMLEPPSYATPAATKTLNRNLREVLEIQKKTPLHELGWYIDQELVSNVYQWIVELHSFEPSLPLAQDMKKAGVTSIVLEIRFGKDYPFSPPFVRVIRPRFMPFGSGGGGHVTAGGAMCMELLTNSGWSSVSTIESVLLQVRMAIMNTEPKPAHLEHISKTHQRDYGTAEAIDAFIRACRTHGWAIPPGFQDFAGAGPSGY